MKTAIPLVILLALSSTACKEEKSKAKDDEKSEKSDKSGKGPADIDVESVIDEVKCKKSDDRKGCACLRDFDKAKTFDDVPDEGQEEWVGRTYALGGSGDGKKQYFFGQFKKGKGNVRVLFPENEEEEEDAKSLVKAASAGDKAPKGSEAAKFIKTSKPEHGLSAIAKTKGTSIKLDEDEGIAYVRIDGDRMLVLESGEGEIEMSFKSQKLKAKAFCSELWKVR